MSALISTMSAVRIPSGLAPQQLRPDHGHSSFTEPGGVLSPPGGHLQEPGPKVSAAFSSRDNRVVTPAKAGVQMPRAPGFRLPPERRTEEQGSVGTVGTVNARLALLYKHSPT